MLLLVSLFFSREGKDIHLTATMPHPLPTKTMIISCCNARKKKIMLFFHLSFCTFYWNIEEEWSTLTYVSDSLMLLLLLLQLDLYLFKYTNVFDGLVYAVYMCELCVSGWCYWLFSHFTSNLMAKAVSQWRRLLLTQGITAASIW